MSACNDCLCCVVVSQSLLLLLLLLVVSHSFVDFKLFVFMPQYQEFEDSLKGRILLAAAKGARMDAAATFGDLDRDYTSVLTSSQFKDGLKALGLDLSSDEMKNLCKRCVGNGVCV